MNKHKQLTEKMGAITLHTFCRMAGCAVALVVHSGNSLVMFLALNEDILQDPDIKNLHAQQFAFFTIWNVAFQIAYSAISLACDLQTIMNINDKGLLRKLAPYKDFFFDSLVWPSTLSIFMAFWPIFLYDREVIFPAYIDKVFTPMSNFIMHFFILLVVLWDMKFQERSDSMLNKERWSQKLLLTVVFVCYLITIMVNYYKNGLWPYPMLYGFFGTIYFPLVCTAAGATLWCSYQVQWPLRRLLSGSDKTKEQ